MYLPDNCVLRVHAAQSCLCLQGARRQLVKATVSTYSVLLNLSYMWACDPSQNKSEKWKKIYVWPK